MSSVPRHSEEELRQQWAFLDALVERQATSLKSGVQDPEEEDLPVAAVEVDGHYQEEISALTRRVTSLESERTTLLRRIDLSEQARMAAESARAEAEAARASAERALAEERLGAGLTAPAPVGPVTQPPVAEPAVAEPAVAEPTVAEPTVAEPAVAEPAVVEPAIAEIPVAVAPEVAQPPVAAPKPVPARPVTTSSRPRRRSWWQRFRE